MAAGIVDVSQRRDGGRVRPEETPWPALALLRPGQQVVLINVGVGGVLVQSHMRMNPGTRTELQLFGTPRQRVRGHIGRCRVAQLDPLRFEGAIVFDERLEWCRALAG